MATYCLLRRPALQAIVVLAVPCQQHRAGQVHGHILGQALCAAAAVGQCLLPGLAGELHPEHAALVLWGRSESGPGPAASPLVQTLVRKEGCYTGGSATETPGLLYASTRSSVPGQRRAGLSWFTVAEQGMWDTHCDCYVPGPRQGHTDASCKAGDQVREEGDVGVSCGGARRPRPHRLHSYFSGLSMGPNVMGTHVTHAHPGPLHSHRFSWAGCAVCTGPLPCTPALAVPDNEWRGV